MMAMRLSYFVFTMLLCSSLRAENIPSSMPVLIPESSYHPDAQSPCPSIDRKLGQYSNISQFAIVESRELVKGRYDRNFRELALVGDGTILEQENFSLAADHTLTISLPTFSSKVTIHVTGDQPSTIAGTLSSNGSIVLINKHGVTISGTGHINCHGFTGTTGDASTSSIVNEGQILCTKSVLLSSRGCVANSNTMCVPGGRIILQGSVVQVKGTLDVSQKGGGGTICIGGGFHGEDTLIPNSKLTVVHKGAVLRADALEQGDGGTVIIWSDVLTRFLGSISAVGRGPKGTGGAAEVASRNNLDFLGDIDLSSTQGVGGPLIFE